MSSAIEHRTNDVGEPAWSDEQGVAFEAARELLNRVHGHLISESRKTSLSDSELNTIEREELSVRDALHSLDPLDTVRISQIREQYGPIVRSYSPSTETHGTTQA